jgi:hypothetical protein
MSDVIAPAGRKAYTPRQSKAEREAHRKEAVQASIPPELEDELRAKAMRQADRERENTPVGDDLDVWVEVDEEGDGKISTGQYVSGVGNVHYDRGERFVTTKAIAAGLKKRHYVIYVDGPDGD